MLIQFRLKITFDIRFSIPEKQLLAQRTKIKEKRI